MTVELTAYPYLPTAGWIIEPAPLRRDWMDQSLRRAAYRCLPLTIANQAGWFIRCPATFKVTWAARSEETHALRFVFPTEEDERHKECVTSTFGSGILSFRIPWVFRTSSGVGLWVRGPTNYPRSDALPLEGIVETYWAPHPFTMNWKVVKPKTDVWFKKGDPICMITPYPIALLEQVKPRIELMELEPELQKNVEQVVRRRMQSIAEERPKEGEWELTYMRGVRPDGVEAKEHYTNIRLAAFEDDLAGM